MKIKDLPPAGGLTSGMIFAIHDPVETDVTKQTKGLTKEQLMAAIGSKPATAIIYFDLKELVDNNAADPGLYLITNATNSEQAGAKADLGILVTVCKNAIGTNFVRLEAEGFFLNPDFIKAGVYDGVEAITGVAAGTNQGIFYLNAVEFNYTSAEGTIAVGEQIRNTSNDTLATVLYNAEGVMILGSPNNSFWADGDVIRCDDDGDSVIISGVSESTDFYNLGDIVIINGMHYQVTNQSQLGNGYPDESDAYTLLQKEQTGMGYIPVADFIMYDFANDKIIRRCDAYENIIGKESVGQFQFGNPVVYQNNTVTGTIININTRAEQFGGNSTSGQVVLNSTEACVGSVISNTFTGASQVFADVNAGKTIQGCIVITQYSDNYTFDQDTDYLGQYLNLIT